MAVIVVKWKLVSMLGPNTFPALPCCCAPCTALFPTLAFSSAPSVNHWYWMVPYKTSFLEEWHERMPPSLDFQFPSLIKAQDQYPVTGHRLHQLVNAKSKTAVNHLLWHLSSNRVEPVSCKHAGKENVCIRFTYHNVYGNEAEILFFPFGIVALACYSYVPVAASVSPVTITRVDI